MKTLQDVEVRGKSVVVRLDLDEPIGPSGELGSDFRLRAGLPTLQYLRDHGAKQIIVVGHLGRPVVRPKERHALIRAGNPRLVAEPVARRLRQLLGKETETIGTRKIEGATLPAYILDRGVYLLENIRFDWRETAGESSLGKELAALGDCYVFDAFADAHRAHASTSAVAHYTEVVAGLRIQEEIANLSRLLQQIESPFVCILGGAKVETKIPVIEYLLDKADTFLIGGVIANTFAKAQGVDVKQSTVGTEWIEQANQLYKTEPGKFVLPSDYVWQGGKIVDVGRRSRSEFLELITTAKTVFWNGTLGVTSTTAREFKFASLDVAQAMIRNTAATTIVSGGDTVGFLQEEGIDLSQFTFVSTGGGATLEFLAGKELPALAALGYKL